MLNMLHFQFRRLFRRSSFYICLGLVVLFVIYILDNMVPKDISNSYSSQYTVRFIIAMCLQLSQLTILFAVFTAIFVCEDRVQGTIKNIYARGYSRITVFFAKYIAATVSAAIFFAAVVIVSMLGALFMGASFSTTGSYSGQFLYYFTSLIAVNTFYYMISELIGKTGTSIVLCIFSPVVIELVVNMILSCFIYSGHSDMIYRITYAFNLYWLPNIVSTFYMMYYMVSDNFDFTTAVLFNVVYIVIFGALALLITNKKQVKG